MIHSMEYWKYLIAHGKIYGLLYEILLGQEYGTVLKSAVIAVNGEVHLSNM